MKKKENKFKKFLIKFLVYSLILVVFFFVAVLGTKYYFYDSDYAVKQTVLSDVSIDDIKLGMNISDVDLSNYTKIEEVVEDCNYNFKELSIKVDSKGKIKYIIANYSKIDLFIGQDQDDTSKRMKKVNEVWEVLGSNQKTELYKEKENNYWKISRYVDSENDIYLGLVFSRYNNELNKIILSDERIKD